MSILLSILMDRAFQRVYFAMLAFTSIFYCIFSLRDFGLPLGFLLILSRVIDLIALNGFIQRKPIAVRILWQGWFIWSVTECFLGGAGRDILEEFPINPFVLIRLIFTGIFLGMLYIYGFIDDLPWQIPRLEVTAPEVVP